MNTHTLFVAPTGPPPSFSRPKTGMRNLHVAMLYMCELCVRAYVNIDSSDLCFRKFVYLIKLNKRIVPIFAWTNLYSINMPNQARTSSLRRSHTNTHADTHTHTRWRVRMWICVAVCGDKESFRTPSFVSVRVCCYRRFGLE